MKLSFQQKQDLSNSIQAVRNINQDMNIVLCGILKSTGKKLIRTDDDINKSSIYAYVLDNYCIKYEEKRVLAITIFEGRFIGVLLNEDYTTLDGMSDDEILELNNWHTMFDGEILSNVTLYNLCKTIEEYI